MPGRQHHRIRRHAEPPAGLPTRFLPRRNRFVFRVPVPEGFTDTDEMIWTLTTRGETEKAYASLRQDYYVDNVVIMSETGALGAGTSIRGDPGRPVTSRTSGTPRCVGS